MCLKSPFQRSLTKKRRVEETRETENAILLPILSEDELERMVDQLRLVTPLAGEVTIPFQTQTQMITDPTSFLLGEFCSALEDYASLPVSREEARVISTIVGKSLLRTRSFSDLLDRGEEPKPLWFDTLTRFLAKCIRYYWLREEKVEINLDGFSKMFRESINPCLFFFYSETNFAMRNLQRIVEIRKEEAPLTVRGGRGRRGNARGRGGAILVETADRVPISSAKKKDEALLHFSSLVSRYKKNRSEELSILKRISCQPCQVSNEEFTKFVDFLGKEIASVVNFVDENFFAEKFKIRSQQSRYAQRSVSPLWKNDGTIQFEGLDNVNERFEPLFFLTVDRDLVLVFDNNRIAREIYQHCTLIVKSGEPEEGTNIFTSDVITEITKMFFVMAIHLLTHGILFLDPTAVFEEIRAESSNRHEEQFKALFNSKVPDRYKI